MEFTNAQSAQAAMKTLNGSNIGGVDRSIVVREDNPNAAGSAPSGDRPPRKPRREFGDRPPRDFGDRPPRDFGDRPPRRQNNDMQE